MALALFAGAPTLSEGASSGSSTTREVRTPRASAVPAPPADPYDAYLGAIATGSDACKSHAGTLQGLLKQREDLVAGLQAGTKPDEALAKNINDLDEKVGAEEEALRGCLEKNNPPEPPPPPVTVPRAKDGSEIPVEKLRSHYFPPIPPAPPEVQVPPPPAREEAYVNYLAALANGSPIVAEMLEDLRGLLAERRESALRYLSAEEATRPFLASQIHALSQRIKATADGIQDAPQASESTQTANR